MRGDPLDRIELNSLTFDELEDFIVSINEDRYRADQLFTFFHKNYGKAIKDLTVFPIRLRDKLDGMGKVNNIEIFKRLDSNIDNTKKYLYLLEDDNIVESVFMEYKHGLTACISTQVGCKMGCYFCASTKDGFVRNLSPAEMLNQVYVMEEDLNNKITNIVLMGSGEPLDNYENVLKFLEIIHHERGHNLSYRNITLSTCGIVPNIYKLAEEGIPITLSISLHSPFDEERRRIMPIGNKYSVSEILQACRYYYEKINRRITIEYTLIEGVNDREEDLLELTKILKGIKCHVNLIPLNPIKEFDYNRPSQLGIKKFKKGLNNKSIPATIRREMGGDINASCGQLRRRYSKDKR
ncbi:MAG: 23S rRNA (adenine(2503)-C(2))-methyltransferase RlmN [Tissierellia bacterium]|nr:23S rRNA (adenine(2503)-C(2))-methyltransferase RlmN [Tissierellia bacterium]